jgi:hypothetical protein
MPFKPTSLPDQIAAARQTEQRAIDAPATSFSGGAAQRAKESSYRWAKSGIDNPTADSAPPWFSGAQPFSETRFQNASNFDSWKQRFVNETDMGWKFAPPPPEPQAPPPDAAAGGKPLANNGENG